MDKYLTISKDAIGEFKDRGSKFLAYLSRVETRDEAELLLQNCRKEHFKARHHCLAYRIGLEEVEERASDDGEPSGSAGMPILNQLRSADLINVAVVVVRYFGGTKLGVPGLIHAYGHAAELGIKEAGIIEREVRHCYGFTFDYQLMSEAMSVLKAEYLHCYKKDLDVKGYAEIGFLPSELDEGLRKMMSELLHLPLEAVDKIVTDHELFNLKPLGIK